MSDKKPEYREDDSWFSQEQLAELDPADVIDHLHTPVPTRMVSNGEYMPHPQTAKQREVENRVKALADEASHKLCTPIRGRVTRVPTRRSTTSTRRA